MSRVRIGAYAVGRSPRGALVQFTDGSLTMALAHSADCTVLLVDPGHTPRTLTHDALTELRGTAA
ncbi:hypothetical protein AB0H97_06145 [Streptomyces sp. NPDC050788]|uniref:hypothetical protein n=1 Tax=Streptomyces sp. NPDC050788 TaxID=3155041 RepID=UPI003444649F